MKPIFYLSILLSSLLLTSCYRKFDLEEYRTTPKMVINSAFSPDTVVMASISRTWFHSESKPDVTIRNAKVELYIDGIFKEEMPWKEYSYWKSSRWLGEDRGGWVTDTLYISNTVPQPGQTVKIVASTPEYGTASAEDKIPSKTEIKGLRIIPRKEATGNGCLLYTSFHHHFQHNEIHATIYVPTSRTQTGFLDILKDRIFKGITHIEITGYLSRKSGFPCI